MSAISRYLPAAAILAIAMASCVTKQYEDCPESRIFDSWAVVDDTKSFGVADSLYYIINPIGNVLDSIYYNGDYTDSYYHSDSTRVMLRYTTSDSIEFRFDRLYSVITNPHNIIMKVKMMTDTAPKDTAGHDCMLHLKKVDNTLGLYRCGPDSLFKELLKKEGFLKFYATNGPSSSNPEGSQNYEFILNTKGFIKAFSVADSLNALRFPGKYRRHDTDSLKSLESHKEKKDKFLKEDKEISHFRHRIHEKRR